MTKVKTAPEADATDASTTPAADTATDTAASTTPDDTAATEAGAKPYDEAYIKDVLKRNGLKKAWVLPGDNICFDEKHAQHIAGEGFDSLPTIEAA